MLVLTACSSNKNQESIENSDRGPASESMDAASGQESKNESAESPTSTKAGEMPKLQTDRKVIFNANLSLTVDDLSNANDRLKKLVTSNNGYIVEASTYSEGDNNYGSMTARIPQDKFYPFLDSAETIGKGTPQKSISGTDVTEEFVDLEARLKAKENVRNRLEVFLENAEKTEDLLAISNDLSRVQEEIEQLKGRMKYLNNQSDYSTITISLEEKKITVPPLGDRDQSTIAEAKQLFMKTANGILYFFSKSFVVIIGLSPVLIPAVAIAIVIWVRYRRKNAKE